jgi:hypothetical protein
MKNNINVMKLWFILLMLGTILATLSAFSGTATATYRLNVTVYGVNGSVVGCPMHPANDTFFPTTDPFNFTDIQCIIGAYDVGGGFASPRWYPPDDSYIYFTLQRTGWYTYQSPVIHMTDNLNITVTMTQQTTPSVTLTIGSYGVTSVSGNTSIRYKILTNGTSEFNIALSHKVSNGVWNQVGDVFVCSGCFFNPIVYNTSDVLSMTGQMDRYCGSNDISALYTSDFGSHTYQSNHLSITQFPPCNNAPTFCGDGICGAGENSTNCPTDCGTGIGGLTPNATNPIIPPESFPPETRFLASFFTPMFISVLISVGIATVVEIVAKTNGMAFIATAIILFLIMAWFMELLPKFIIIIFILIAGGIFIMLITKVFGGGR